MFKHLFKYRCKENDLPASQLYNEQTFYKAFEQSIEMCEKEIVIESPFLTQRRVLSLISLFQKARARGVSVIVNTRDPNEHDDYMKYEAEQAINLLLKSEVAILFTGKLHRKLAIVDRKILWEGSLNILSQNDSCEIMRKTDSKIYALQLINFIGIKKFLPRV